MVTDNVNDNIILNLKPILQIFKHKLSSLCKLPLSVTGRANLIKMVWAPQLLNVLHNVPVWIPRYWVQQVDSLYQTLLWKNGVASLKLTTLQYPKDQGGLAVPRAFTYFLAAQLQQLTGWDIPNMLDPSRTLLISSLADYFAVSQVEQGFSDMAPRCPTAKLILKLWAEFKCRLGIEGFMESISIWSN